MKTSIKSPSILGTNATTMKEASDIIRGHGIVHATAALARRFREFAAEGGRHTEIFKAHAATLETTAVLLQLNGAVIDD